MQPQQRNQNLMLNNTEKVSFVPRPHHNTQHPSLSGINPFVIPGFGTPITLPRLTVTPIHPQNNAIPLVDPLDNVLFYFQGSASVNTGHVCNLSENSSRIKIILVTLGYGPQNNIEVFHLALILVVEGCNTVTAANANAAIHRNLPLFARKISQSRDYLYKMSNFPNVPITTINMFMNSAWRQNALYENP